MTAAFYNALWYLVTAAFNFGMGVFLIRILLQAVRADFYNPISQLVWKLTQAVTGPLHRVLPRPRGRVDIACILVLYALALLEVEIVTGLLNLPVTLPMAATYAALKLLSLTLNLYTLFLFVQAILSWVGPGVSNPAANILWSLNEPLLRPVRRFIPTISGIDLSPMFVMVVLQLIDRIIQQYSIAL